MSESSGGGNLTLNIISSVLLLLGSAFFVSAEYAIVSLRKGRLESLAKGGNKTSRQLLAVSEDPSSYIAGTQIGITMIGIAIGSFTEPFITALLLKALSGLDARIGQAISFVIVLFALLILGELVPKYVALRNAERLSLIYFKPLSAFVVLFRPVIYIAQQSSFALLRLFRINPKETPSDRMLREELIMMLQATTSEGILEKEHAVMVNRALNLDGLVARDIMIHRLDIDWLDASLGAQEAMSKAAQMGHSRYPVCNGDVDELVGIVYLIDIIKNQQKPNFSLQSIARQIVGIPENLTMERIVQTMREEKTQMLLVLDEYGGTSGLISLEDVVEEVFGELEDGPESERSTIEVYPSGRVSARAEIRMDELLSKLGLELELENKTETLATVITDQLERIARPGDVVQTPIGTLRVENMARRRITRVGVQLNPEIVNPKN